MSVFGDLQLDTLVKEGGEATNRSLQIGVGGDVSEGRTVFGGEGGLTDAVGGSNLLKGTQLASAQGGADNEINTELNTLNVINIA